MNTHVGPDEAARALGDIQARQAHVIDSTKLPGWYWWTVGAATVAFGFGIDLDRPVTIGVGTMVFVLASSALIAAVAIKGRRAPARNELLGPIGVLAIFGFAALVIGMSVAVGFALDAADFDYPITAGTAFGAVLMVAASPVLNRLLRRIMLANSTGNRPGTSR